MRRATLTVRFLTLGLAVAATACRSTPAHAQGGEAPVDSSGAVIGVVVDGTEPFAQPSAAQPLTQPPVERDPDLVPSELPRRAAAGRPPATQQSTPTAAAAAAAS